MSRKSILQADFDHLVYLIQNRVTFSPEEKELWDRYLKKIEDELDRPIDAEPIVPYKVTKNKDMFTESIWRRFKNWLILKLK